MNERIKKLAVKAQIYFSYDRGPGTDNELQAAEITQSDFEKFAELIVRECADICYHHSNAAGGVDTHFGYGYKDCGDDIKRNFGVKK